MKSGLVFLAFAFALMLTVSANATVINVPADQPTIQAGIDAAVDGDTVLVDTGTYYENISLHGKGIVVTSKFILSGDTLDIESTQINGSQPLIQILRQ